MHQGATRVKSFLSSIGKNRSSRKAENSISESEPDIIDRSEIPTSDTDDTLNLDDFSDGDLGSKIIPKNHQRICIHRSLQEILSDPVAATHFSRYMDSKDSKAYIKLLADLKRFSSLSVLYSDMITCKKAVARSGNDFTVETAISPGSESSGFSEDFVPEMKEEQSYSNHRSEAIEIFNRYISKDAIDPVGVSGELRTTLIKKIFDQTYELNEHCFLEVEDMVVKILEEEFLADFFSSRFAQKYLLDLLTSAKAQIIDLLSCELSFSYLSEFMSKTEDKSLLNFWLSVNNFKAQISSSEDVTPQVQEDAMVLYNRFFSLQATDPLSISEKYRSELELNICREGGPSFDCFDGALSEALNLINERYLPVFTQSETYFNFLAELMRACRDTELHHKRQGSDSTTTSDFSLSTQSVFNYPVAQRSRGSTLPRNVSFSINVKELSDPDTIWKRHHSRSLSLGSVSEFGRFRPELEPQPDVKPKESIKTAVRKFITKEDDSVFYS
ncbi:hypothetical protein QYM36_017729 [Artemia franciscana]|uniref:RGS domain-containing protein n=1 Tax=Artemia franciscana TaxID=6661 RepID=A0AA88HE86_ARTSF|nr:hypothetical protein QYM36_017729 [Artemia franciscana]